MSDLAARLPDVGTLMRDLDAAGYLADEPLGVGAVPGRPDGPADPARGRARGRQDRGGQGAGQRAGHAADPAAVLRGADRRRGAVRVELPAPAAGHPAGRGPRRDAARRRPVQRGLPAGPAAAGRAATIPARGPAVLLIDEVDRGDDEFEAFLFELLAESAVTIPELGTRRAALPPVVVLTSNRTRDLHDALKRRCLYHWIEYPDTDRVAAIIRRRVPAAAARWPAQVAPRRRPAARPRPGQAARRGRGDQLGRGAVRARRRPSWTRRRRPGPPAWC